MGVGTADVATRSLPDPPNHGAATVSTNTTLAIVKPIEIRLRHMSSSLTRTAPGHGSAALSQQDLTPCDRGVYQSLRSYGRTAVRMGSVRAAKAAARSTGACWNSTRRVVSASSTMNMSMTAPGMCNS